MIVKSEGIVLRTMPYAESSMIARILTRRAGLEGFIIQGLRRRGPGKAALLQPLSRIDLVYYVSARKGLRRIKEMELRHIYQSIPFDARKSAIALFIAELLSISLREEEPDESLFNFLEKSLERIDATGEAVEWQPLHFMVHLTRYLGFYPNAGQYRPGYRFNLTQGVFSESVPDREVPVEPPLAGLLVRLLNTAWEDLQALHENGMARRQLLEALVRYYELHLPQGPRLRSHGVLHEALS
jgi:DNA repair protein RecO (recombination protein O)